ncbi:MAG: fatty acid desaturase [Planctomycetota bacterium]|nr:fatty acid desaturase [Planctomycetota bacterium]
MTELTTIQSQSSTDAQMKIDWQAHTGGVATPTILFFSAIVLVEIAVWTLAIQGLLPLAIASVIATVCAYGSFTVMHEASHSNIDGGQSHMSALEECLGWISGVILFAPYSGFRVAHLMHHAHVNEADKDPDHWVAVKHPLAVLFRCSTVSLHYYYQLFVGPISKEEAARETLPSTVIGVLFMLGLCVVLTILDMGHLALFLWVLPAFVAMAFLALTFDWIPHHPHTEKEDFRDTRILLVPGLTLPLLWQNFHLVHHLQPRVPFYKYARWFHEHRAALEQKNALIEGYEEGLPGPFQSRPKQPEVVSESVAISPSSEGVSHSAQFKNGDKSFQFEITEQETILEAAIARDVPIKYACKRGRCGTCVLSLDAGEVSMTDAKVLLKEEEEAGLILACRAHAKSPLELRAASNWTRKRNPSKTQMTV